MTKINVSAPQDLGGPQPIALTRGRWLVRRILAMFREWDVRPGEQAPYQVEVADELGIWHTRVSAAYRRLRGSGYLTGGGRNFPYWVVAVDEVLPTVDVAGALRLADYRARPEELRVVCEALRREVAAKAPSQKFDSPEFDDLSFREMMKARQILGEATSVADLERGVALIRSWCGKSGFPCT